MLVWDLIIKKNTIIIFIFFFEIKKTLTKAVNMFLKNGQQEQRHMLLKKTNIMRKKSIVLCI